MLNPELHAFLEYWDGKWSELAPDATPKERRAIFEMMANWLESSCRCAN
jgi:hypothetical protein